jgi:hypothetical protein
MTPVKRDSAGKFQKGQTGMLRNLCQWCDMDAGYVSRKFITSLEQ